VARFLDFASPTHGWDPTLAGVMGGAVGVNLLTFRYVARRGGGARVETTAAACRLLWTRPVLCVLAVDR
jgi:hypothetical protein